MNKKLMDYLEKFALRESPFGGVVWNSSAKDLEQDLAKRGIKTKLYYKYALPENMTPQKFMTRIAVLNLCMNFSVLEHREMFFDKSLSLIERFRIVKYIASERAASRKKIDEYVKFIQFANPELSELKVQSDADKDDILRGAAFGFAPDEIKWYMSREERKSCKDKEREVYKKFERLGVLPQYVLAPQTAKRVIAELEKNRKVTMLNPRLRGNVRVI